MEKGLRRLQEAGVRNVSLTDFDALVEAAVQEGCIAPADAPRLIAFRDNPSDESWMTRKE
jgi:orotate phosphoribosyltransferase